jgi:hypothetical protein
LIFAQNLHTVEEGSTMATASKLNWDTGLLGGRCRDRTCDLLLVRQAL